MAALDRYAILDTGREGGFDDIATLAADILEAPIAVVNFIASDRQWFKAETGIGQDSLPLDVSICRYALLGSDVLVVPDLTKDQRFDGNPLVHVADGLRFYAGALLETPDGLPLGTICVLDTQARPDGVTDRQLRALKALAAQTMTQLELRRSEVARDRAAALSAAQNRILELAVKEASLGTTLEAVVATVESLSTSGALASILLLDEDGMHLRHGAAPSLPDAYNSAIDGIAVGPATGSCGTAVHRGEPVFVSDIATDPLWVDFRELALEHGLRACWSIPIRSAQGVVLGTFAIYYRTARAPTTADQDSIDFVVRTAGLIIERANAARMTLRSEARLRFLRDLEDRLFHSADASQAMADATELLGRRLGASRCAYADVDADSDRFWIRSDYTAPGLESSVGEYSLDLFGPRAATGLRAGAVLVVADVGAELEPGQGREMFHAIAIDAIVCCPLVKNGRLIAMMAVHQDQPRVWSADEVALIREVVERCWAHVERVGAEARLRDSEERLRLAVSGAEIGFWDVDEVNDVLIWPDRTKAMFGIAPETPVTMHDFYDGLHPEDREATGTAYAAAADPAVRALYDMEYRTVGPTDGAIRWVAARGRGVFDGAGADAQCLRVAGTAIDITARKAAEMAALESEARYRLLFEAIDVGFSIIEMKFDAAGQAIDYRFAEINPAFERQTGLYGAAGRWISNAAPGLEQHWFDTYGRVATTGESVRFENFAEPMERWFDVYAFRTGKPQEQRVGLLFNDITARRTAEDRLRELNDTLELQVAARSAERDRLWNLSQDLLARADYSGMMSAVSPAWARVLGWSEAELLSRGYDTFMHPDDASPTLAAIAQMAASGAPARFENRIATRGGGWKPIEWTVAPEADGTNFIAVGRDLSDAKAREADLEAARVALRQAQKMEAMGQLTGGVAHDFNNLLTPIVGSLDLLQRKGLGGEREQRLIAGAAQSAERARTLVQRLLAFARRQPLQPVPVDVATLITGMGDLVSSTTGPQIKVVVEAASDLPPALADPNQLEMAILNLAVNARDAMPDGGTLRITANREAIGAGHRSALCSGDYLRLSVADTGDGMDETTLARAVEPFFSTKGVGKGTGLGLSMVHGLASQLGGAITIQSHPGLGTNVELWLPQSASAPANDDTIEAAAIPSATGTALLVDDEELVRMTTADMLNDLGYAVIEAASGEEALRLIGAGSRFDVLVTDHLMPGMTGTELAVAARSARPGMPVLLVSGYAENQGIDPGLPRLTKPFRKDELAVSLNQLLAGGLA